METACAPTARFVAYADGAPMVLRDIEDLHDADLENELADRLTEASGTPGPRAFDAAAVAAATGVSRLVAQSGRAALLAHDLGRRAACLTGR